MSVGSERGTTHFDAVYADQLYVAGTIVGSVSNVGTENVTSEVEGNISVSGTITGSEGVFTNLGVKGTTTGSMANLSVVNSKGTITGTYINGSYIAAPSIAAATGDVYGSQVTGTLATLTHVNSKGTIIGTKGIYTALEGSTITGTSISGSAVVGSHARFTDLGATGTLTGTYVNGSIANLSHVNTLGTVTGTTANVTTLNAVAVNGSVVTGTALNGSAIVGSIANISHVNTLGTVTGTTGNISTVNALALNGSVITGTSLTGSSATVPIIANSGSLIGSNLYGTLKGGYVAATDSVPTASLIAFKVVGTGVTTSNGSYAHGLGAAPEFVSIVARTNFMTGGGTDARPPWMPAAADATNVFVVAGTTGTVDIYALA